MHQHARLALATATALSLATGLLALGPAPASAADNPQETVVPATQRSADLSVSLFPTNSPSDLDGAGALGAFHRLEGHSGLVWTRYSDGETFPVSEPEGDAVYAQATGGDTLAYRVGDQVVLWDAVGRTARTVPIPEGHSYYRTLGSTVVTRHTVTAEDGTDVRVMHLLTAEPDGTVRDVAVTGMPTGSLVGNPLAADERTLVFSAQIDGQRRMVLADLATGRVESWTAPLPDGYHYAALTGDRLVMYSTSVPAVLSVARTDPAAVPAETLIEGGGVQPSLNLAVVGDWLVYTRSAGPNLVVVKAAPIAGGEPVTLLDQARTWVSAGPGGTAAVVARDTTGEWALQRLAADGDGRPAATVFKPLPRPPLDIQGLTLSHGRLVVADSAAGHNQRRSWARTLPTTGTPEAGERTRFLSDDSFIPVCRTQEIGCERILSSADGRIAWLLRDDEDTDRLRTNSGWPSVHHNDHFEQSVPSGGRITDVSGHYLVHTAPGQQTVLRVGHYGPPVLTREPGPAAVWGDVLWTPGAEPGTVTGYDLAAKRTAATVDTEAGCAPEELQAVGRWLYVDCSGTAPSVVHDREAGTTVAVPAGEALLGDGYVVTHDRASGDLTLTTVTGTTATGTAATGRVIGRLPDTGRSQRHVRWTVDEFGGHAAWVDDQERVHLVPSGAPTGALTAVGAPRKSPEVWAATAEAAPTPLTSVLLSKPAAGWKLTVRDAVTGRTVDTSTGGPARGRLEVGWHGLHPGGSRDVFLPNGRYRWTLAVTPADGRGPALTYGGTTVLRGGSQARHDHAGTRQPDGVGDLVTVSSGGWLTFQHGDGSGGFSGKTGFYGWSNRITPVSFGDLDGDRCNDLLMRMPDGELRGYRPECGEAVGFDTPHTSLGTGWGAYDVLTSPGDLTGDGRADLLARRTSTGDIHLFAAKADGTLAAGRKIRSGWTYTKIVGVGDLNGDGHGDLLAHRRDGALFRYDGTGTGLLKSRVQLSAKWGLSYDTVAGVGDITGDGHADIVVRNTDGVLYRNHGKGDGTFTKRTEIGAGWGGYKGLF
ncbi:FG-GAP repeat domain-containing protein [Streptomyces radiopugnans]|uniref:Repeat domain-containing protein n=1 Tax=Streptomyces radiopugnans TaxID=403935 RepID=A0A1H9CM55_9ACTN|nr:VCBS repeat-containing protein [Streptomyces radiopugnans]SEQ02244.1 Repeat domain-containing protein [Streptomyces radiopugnans]